jgi:hypothetical protein
VLGRGWARAVLGRCWEYAALTADVVRR